MGNRDDFGGWRYRPDEDMGGSEWSGASGRGGMSPEQERRLRDPREFGGAYGGRSFEQWAAREARGSGGWSPSTERHREGRPIQQRGLYAGGGYPGAMDRPAEYGDRVRMEGEAFAGSPGYASMRRGEREWNPAAGMRPQTPAAPPQDRGPHYGKGPKGYKRSDDRIREEICEIFWQDGQVDASDVEVLVEGGVVRLVGTVARREDKRLLEHLIDDVHGVDDVRNELRLQSQSQSQSQTQSKTSGPASKSPGQPNASREAPERAAEPNNGKIARS